MTNIPYCRQHYIARLLFHRLCGRSSFKNSTTFHRLVEPLPLLLPPRYRPIPKRKLFFSLMFFHFHYYIYISSFIYFTIFLLNYSLKYIIYNNKYILLLYNFKNLNLIYDKIINFYFHYFIIN